MDDEALTNDPESRPFRQPEKEVPVLIPIQPCVKEAGIQQQIAAGHEYRRSVRRPAAQQIRVDTARPEV